MKVPSRKQMMTVTSHLTRTLRPSRAGRSNGTSWKGIGSYHYHYSGAAAATATATTRVAATSRSLSIKPSLLAVSSFATAGPLINFATSTKRGFLSTSKREGVSDRAAGGRVATTQVDKKKKSGRTALCTGCGTLIEFVRSSSKQRGGDQAVIRSGRDAVGEGVGRKQNARDSYMDVWSDARPSSKRNSTLCDRCQSLQRKDIWKAYDALHDVEPAVFSKQLKHIVARRRFGISVLIVDATDPEHSAMKNVRKMVGKLPCWLVLNKIDLVPRMNERDQRFLSRRVSTMTGGVQFEHTYAVSAAMGDGVHSLAENMLMNLRGRDVFIMGAANVGKSTLVKNLATRIADAVYMKDSKTAKKRKDAIANMNVTESHLPGTTLQALRIPCFPSVRHALWDTPGIINHKAIQYSIFPSHLMEPLTRPGKIPLPSEADHIFDLRKDMTLLIEAGWMDDDADTDTDESMDADDDTDTDDDTDKSEHMDTNGDASDSSSHAPCVLGRIDLVDIEQGRDVYVQGFLHPSLRLRVVPTRYAPDHANIPQHYIRFVQKLMGHTNKKLTESHSVPLRPVDDAIVPDGLIIPGPKEQSNNGKYYMDIVFASLGWISFTHEKKFILKPFCCKGSVFSKRKAMYPNNLRADLEGYSMASADEEGTEDELRKRLRDAAKDGRHQAPKEHYGRRGSRGGSYDDEIYDDFVGEEFW